REWIKKSPKLTESSLKPLGEIGEMIMEYNALSGRFGVLNGWIKESERDGRLHGRMWTIGTPTFRCRHETIANLPTVKAAYGPEIRALLKPQPGWKIVGADSSGNQMRGLCHYLGNDEFTNEVINGDLHTRNKEILAGYMKEAAEEETPEAKYMMRDRAKRFLYAYLFGAGAKKVSMILQDKENTKDGKEAIDLFETAIPGLAEHKAALKAQFDESTKNFGPEYAHIRGIDGRLIFVKSAH